MFVRTFVPLAAALVLLAGTAMAQTNTDQKSKPLAHSQERCNVLEKQFDAAVKQQAATPTVTTAKALRSDGRKLCDDGDMASGVNKLEMALKQINVEPLE